MGGVVVHRIQEDYRDAAVPENTQFSKATYYRLSIADYLKDVSVCLYLDSDLVVNKDIDDAFSYGIEGKYVLGVKQIGNRLNKQSEIWLRENWGLPSVEQYVNCGILLMNLKKMREDGIVQKFMSYIENSPEVDQFVINKVCYGGIGFLPYKYNVANRMTNRMDILKKIFSEEEIYDAVKEPVILHYVDKKPWHFLNVPNAEKWWDYAAKTPVYQRMLSELLEYSFHPKYTRFGIADNMDELLTYLRGKRVIIYGAGDYGLRFYRLMRSRSVYPLCFAVSDNQEHKEYIDDFQIRKISELVEYLDKCVVIVAMSEPYQKEVRGLLDSYAATYYCINLDWLNAYDNQLNEGRKNIAIS